MILFIAAFLTNIFDIIKIDTLSFVLKVFFFFIEEYFKCVLRFMGVSDFKIFMFENC